MTDAEKVLVSMQTNLSCSRVVAQPSLWIATFSYRGEELVQTGLTEQSAKRNLKEEMIENGFYEQAGFPFFD